MTPQKRRELEATRARLRNARPNRVAAGMTFTLERQRASGTFRGYKGPETARLAVHGTLDRLATSFPAIGKARCPCCNGTGRAGYELSDAGRRRLQRLRRERATRFTES